MATHLGYIFSCQFAQLVQQNTTFIRAQEHQQNAQFIKIQQQLGQILVAGSLHRRGSVASLHSIASFALSIGQRKVWKELSKELHCDRITAEMIKAKKDEIFKLF